MDTKQQGYAGDVKSALARIVWRELEVVHPEEFKADQIASRIMQAAMRKLYAAAARMPFGRERSHVERIAEQLGDNATDLMLELERQTP